MSFADELTEHSLFASHVEVADLVLGEALTVVSMLVKVTKVIRVAKFEAKDNNTNVNCGFGDEGVVVTNSSGADNAGGIFECAFVKSRIDVYAPFVAHGGDNELDAHSVSAPDMSRKQANELHNLVDQTLQPVVSRPRPRQRLSFAVAVGIKAMLFVVQPQLPRDVHRRLHRSRLRQAH